MMRLKYYISLTINHFRQLILLAFLLSLSFNSAGSQLRDYPKTYLNPQEIWEFGLPFIENYSSDEYRSSPQNWAILEGNDGFIYMGNTYGILQYDGYNWKTIKLENKGLVRSLAKTDGEKIFVGGVHELGYLEPDELGRMQYHSLLSKLPATYREFGNVGSTTVKDNNIYFSCDKYLFRWNGKKFKIWQAKVKYSGIFNINGALYIESKGVGIHRVDGDSLHLISAGDVLQNNKAKIDVMLSYQNNKILLATANKGLLLFDGEGLSSFNQKSNEIFLKHRIYKGIILSNGDYAMATITSGLYILDGKTGAIKKRLGKKQGLISDALFSVFEDSYGVIWVGSDNGISKIDWASPFRKLNELSGLVERVRSVSYQNHKFLVDSKGLYQLVKRNLHEDNNELTFQKIEGIEGGIKFILPFKDYLLAFDSENIYKIDNKNKAQLIKKESWSLTYVVKSKIDSSKIYAGTLEGKLFECQYSDNKWYIKLILQIDGGIEAIVEEPNGDLWLQTHYKGLFFAVRQSGVVEKQTSFKLIKYDTLSGLPSMTYNFPYLFNEKIYATTLGGMYWFNEINQAFEKDTLLTNQYDKSVDAYGYMGIDRNGNIWQTVKAGFENKVYMLSGNKLSELSEYNLYSDFETYSMEFLDDIILFTGPKGILLYNQNASRSLSKSVATKLREVYVNNESIIYAGSNSNKSKEDRFALPNKSNTLKFEYTLPFYIKPKDNAYQYILEGFDKNWSNWTHETKKEYTHLPAGNYTFKVRSKNIFNYVSEEDSYSFSILPPWYGTWWAYISYGLGLLAIVSLIIQWRSKELQRKNEILEKTIIKRTIEIQQKNKLLNHQTMQLVELNEAKTKLYSNITHEFRTPLTVILGMADTLESDYKNKIFNNAEKSLKMIRRNGKNLLHLVNELLDLAKIESGSMVLNLIQIDAVPFIKYLSESFHSLTEIKKISLTVYSEIDTLEMDIDINKMNSIISNLLSNAIKFTSTGGKVIVHLNKTMKEKDEFLIVKVQDNGLGLAEEDIAHLFDRFYQVNNISAKQEGTGIGLALTKEFVELMNGNITVDSTLGKGSTFTIKIPVYNKALKTGEEKVLVEPLIASLPIPQDKLLFTENTSELPLVLLIEDNVDVAHYLKTCLKEKYQTMHALNGDEGIQMAFENIPDIIISDVMMPKKDGFEVCATLKTDERTDHIPIILLTAKATIEDKLIGLSHGADAYLEKPFNQNELFTRLDQLILVRQKLIRKLDKDGLSSLTKGKIENPQTKFLRKLVKSVQENMGNANFSPTQLAEEMHLSESQIYRKLKSITDKSTAIFIRSVRLQKAKELIKTTSKTISEIAYEVGFNDPSWFSRAFKEEFGHAPTESDK